MADQSFCAKRLDWDAPVTEVQTLRLAIGASFNQKKIRHVTAQLSNRESRRPIEINRS